MKALVIFASIYLFFTQVCLAGIYPSDPIKRAKKIKKQVKFHVKRSPQVYFLKDDHKQDQTSILSELTIELKKQDPKIDCLFLEQPTELQSRIEEYLITDDFSPYQNHSAQISERNFAKVNQLGLNEIAELLKTSKEIGIKTYAMDTLPSLGDVLVLKDLMKEKEKYPLLHRDYIYYHYGHKRNISMANFIADELSNKSCQKAIALNGYSHLTKKMFIESFGIESRTMPQILREDFEIKSRILMSW